MVFDSKSIMSSYQWQMTDSVCIRVVEDTNPVLAVFSSYNRSFGEKINLENYEIMIIM